MEDLHRTVERSFAERYMQLADLVRGMAKDLTDEQFWRKPFPYGNSFGHLVLHLTGNLNYYIGAQIAQTGYVRDRPREFNDPNPPSKEDALRRFDDAVGMVIKIVHAQTPEDWWTEYSGVGTNAK